MARGPHPEDKLLFAPEWVSRLRLAVEDYSYLLGRGYGPNAALTLVGDRYQLHLRQRVAVGRCSCSLEARERRMARRVNLGDVSTVYVDGLNVLTTVEVAIAGGVVLRARDGCFRDLASFHGSYRLASQARVAAALLGDALGARKVLWFLDRPVSNTGRLAGMLRELAVERGWNWEVELVPDPDRVLRECGEVVATSDSGILDRAGAWTQVGAVEKVEGAWILDLS